MVGVLHKKRGRYRLAVVCTVVSRGSWRFCRNVAPAPALCAPLDKWLPWTLSRVCWGLAGDVQGGHCLEKLCLWPCTNRTPLHVDLWPMVPQSKESCASPPQFTGLMKLCSCHCARVAPQVLISETASHWGQPLSLPQACLRVACQSLRAEFHLGVSRESFGSH